MVLSCRRQASSPLRSLYCYCANLLRCNPRLKRMFVISALHLKTSRIQNQNDMTSPTLDTAHPLNGQVALITGAGRGIGAAIARKLAELGATTVLCGRTRTPLESVAALISQSGGRAEVVECDVMDLRSVAAVASQVDRSFGRADILVNNAGVDGFAEPLHQMSPEAWEQILNTNLRGAYYSIRSFAPMMIRAQGGHIINISSLAG